ncbi:facilitated trehalose transporter Tret1-like isoform X1 [Harmonia axyridis]|uniref:facilitated trehalose transporter Tret1-like isoform X1 n=1 Tax=Harmonia axyridis TaxID=115357 RepID=UPI001E275DBC|nr:facilitated trehalose transporter Tret1-like isoform X1 [Harmonia axyridis]
MMIHPFFRQVGSLIGCYLITMGMSSVLGYSSVLIPQMQLRTSRVQIKSQHEISLVASIAALPLALGTILNGYLMEKYGRKPALIFSQIPAPGWLIIALSQNIYMVYTGRFLTGWSAGMCSGLANVYVAEIASIQYRSILLALLNFCINLGILLCHIFGLLLEWQYSSIVIFAYAVLGTIFMFFSPETPFWLILNDKYDRSAKIFTWLRGLSEEDTTSPEFEGLKKKAEYMKSMQKGFKYYMNCFLRPEFYKPLTISSMFFLISQFSGISSITFYSMTIFQEVLGPEFPGEVAMITVDTLRLVCSLVTIVLMQYISRRVQALISGGGVTFSLLLMSIYSMVCNSFGYDINYLVPLCSVVTYICFMSFGFMPLPWCMLGELFSADNKGLGAGISSTISYLAAFVVVNSLPYMFSNLGSDGTFLTYGIIAMLGTVYLFFFLPETRNKTFAEIEENYKKKTSEITANQ